MRLDPYILLSKDEIICEQHDECNSNLSEQQFYTYAKRFNDDIYNIDNNTILRNIDGDCDDYSYDYCIPCFRTNNLLYRYKQSSKRCLSCPSFNNCSVYMPVGFLEDERDNLVFCQRCYDTGKWKCIFKLVSLKFLEDDREFGFDSGDVTLEKVLRIKSRINNGNNGNNGYNRNNYRNPFI